MSIYGAYGLSLLVESTVPTLILVHVYTVLLKNLSLPKKARTIVECSHLCLFSPCVLKYITHVNIHNIIP